MLTEHFTTARRRVAWAALILLMSLWLAPTAARAQAPEGRGSDPAWQASYWTNPTLAGDPILTRDEANIAYNWGSGSPAPQVPADRFSARWSRYIYFDRESVYRFALASDDGARLFIDGQMVIDAWYDHTYKTFIADKRLAAGHHLVQVEYYDNAGAARVDFSWQDTAAPPPPTPAPPTATPVSGGTSFRFFVARSGASSVLVGATGSGPGGAQMRLGLPSRNTLLGGTLGGASTSGAWLPTVTLTGSSYLVTDAGSENDSATIGTTDPAVQNLRSGPLASGSGRIWVMQAAPLAVSFGNPDATGAAAGRMQIVLPP